MGAQLPQVAVEKAFRGSVIALDVLALVLLVVLVAPPTGSVTSPTLGLAGLVAVWVAVTAGLPITIGLMGLLGAAFFGAAPLQAALLAGAVAAAVPVAAAVSIVAVAVFARRWGA